MKLCGKCLHDIDCHTEHNGHFMYCGACQKLCDKDTFSEQYQPTDIATIMRIGAMKQ